MSGINKKLKAYVRYDGTGRIVGGGPIIQPSKPKDGNWKEIPMYKCCTPAGVSCNNFFINQVVGPDPLCQNATYAMGSALDSQCNSYLLSVSYCLNPENPTEQYENGILQKFADNGDLIWEKGFTFAEDGGAYQYVDWQTIAIDKNDNPIVFPVVAIGGSYYTGVTKFDKDGNQLWSTLLSEYPDNPYFTSNREFVLTVAFDNSNNIYISTYIYNTAEAFPGVKSIRKISPTGVLLSTALIDPGTGMSGNISAYMNINSIGQIYITTQYSSLNKIFVTKLDSSFNEIWTKSFDIPSSSNNAPTNPVFDKQENIVVYFGAGTERSTAVGVVSYIKLSPSGDIIWTSAFENISDSNKVLGSYSLYGDSEGNIYPISTYVNNITGYPESFSNNVVLVSKISPAGNLEWSYGISVPSIDFNTWFWFSPIVGNIANNSITLEFYGPGDPYDAQLMKLPLTPVSGTYGSYTFTDITNLWTKSTPSITLNDDSVTIITSSLTTSQPTYVEFLQTTNITKTVI